MLKGDLLYDGIEQEFTADIRDISLSFSPLQSLDMKVGRQVLTWGTGDLLFLNDLFPKDWVSFFAGRDDEYLKAPSNSFRATQYNNFVNIDFAWTPEFRSDIYIRRRALLLFLPACGQRSSARFHRFGSTTPTASFPTANLPFACSRPTGASSMHSMATMVSSRYPAGLSARTS